MNDKQTAIHKYSERFILCMFVCSTGGFIVILDEFYKRTMPTASFLLRLSSFLSSRSGKK